MSERTIEIGVGFFVALGLAALVMLAMKVSNLAELTGGSTYDVIAHFDNVGSLKVRAPVKMSGVPIGRVAAITLDRQRLDAKVTLAIDSRYNDIPKDTSAAIYTSGLLGEQYVSLQPGGDTAVLKNGSRITLTQSALVLEQVIGKFLYSKAASGAGK